jgi:wyosine [tRNA(Phe)-imidazoG37] synthetase (radical SAM superfamily)
MLAFGPIPSRRLGRSLGINNIPFKYCSYSCVYCQLGRTINKCITRNKFYTPEQIYKVVSNKVEMAGNHDEHIDYLSFVPDGEPTLDVNLGRTIGLLKSLGIKIAVITNSSLLSHEEVRIDLCGADLVSVKIDTVDDITWRRINRPHKDIEHSSALNGIVSFGNIFRGRLITETMLVKNINDNSSNINEVAGFISDLRPDAAYITIPLRPPAVRSVRPPDESVVNTCYQIFNERIKHVECLTGYEGNEFAFTGNIEDDILSITAVHPMRQDAVYALLEKSGKSFDVINRLVEQGQLVEAEYNDKKYYLRKLKGHLA